MFCLIFSLFSFNKYKNTGSVQTFTARHSTSYKIECWGASGGDSPVGGTGIPGRGGYVKGLISLSTNIDLYIYVGGKGTNSNTIVPNSGGWNGGGYGNTNNHGNAGSGGGGATDIRINQHTENDGWSGITSLRSRIIVAAGGGGCNYISGNAINGGYGGGLVGEDSPYNDGYPADVNNATGATQTQGGIDPATRNPSWSPGWYSQVSSGNLILSGTFGYANIPGYDAYWGGGGGGGWYGGAIGHGRGGSGGSSFISGHTGCNAINPSTGAHLGASTTMTINNVNYRFTNTVMKAGNEVMPSPTGGTETGHSGNGYCKITWQPAL